MKEQTKTLHIKTENFPLAYSNQAPCFKITRLRTSYQMQLSNILQDVIFLQYRINFYIDLQGLGTVLRDEAFIHLTFFLRDIIDKSFVKGRVIFQVQTRYAITQSISLKWV